MEITDIVVSTGAILGRDVVVPLDKRGVSPAVGVARLPVAGHHPRLSQ